MSISSLYSLSGLHPLRLDMMMVNMSQLPITEVGEVSERKSRGQTFGFSQLDDWDMWKSQRASGGQVENCNERVWGRGNVAGGGTQRQTVTV